MKNMAENEKERTIYTHKQSGNGMETENEKEN